MTDLSKIYKKIPIGELLQNWPDLLALSDPKAITSSDIEVLFISSVENPESKSMVFISEIGPFLNLKDLNPSTQSELVLNFLKTPPLVAVLPLNVEPEIINIFNKHSILTLKSPNPKLAMALVSQKYLIHPRINHHFEFSESDIHPTAIIHPSAQVGKSVKIGPYSVVGKNTKVGDFSRIASHVVIESDVEVGTHGQFFSGSIISWGTVMGDHCLIQSNSCIGSDGFGYATDPKGQHFEIPHVGRVRFGHHVHIGAGTQIDRGTYGETYIGDFTKIDNLVHIAHNCKIGKSCLITGGFMVAGSTEIGNFFVCGGRTTVTGHIKITDHVQLAGLSGVQKSVTQSGKYGGHPLIPLNEYLRVLSSSTKILEFRKDISRLMKHLNLKKD